MTPPKPVDPTAMFVTRVVEDKFHEPTDVAVDGSDVLLDGTPFTPDAAEALAWHLMAAAAHARRSA